MTINEIKDLALCSVRKEAPENYSLDKVNLALRDGFRELAGSINQFMKNRYDIYEIITTAANEVTPKRVIDALGAVAEIKSVGQNQKAIFKRRVGRNRAKTFFTQVGLSGVYETFRLDTETFSLGAHAVGGAVTIDFERMLDDAEVLSEMMDIIVEGIIDSVFVEVQRALLNAVESLPATNKVEMAGGFDADTAFKIIQTVKSYADNAVILAPAEFVAEMGPDAIVPVNTGSSIGGVYHPDDIDSIHKTGYIKVFRGTPIVTLPHAYLDETNTTVGIKPDTAYVLPAGKEKIVKVVLEGDTQINDFKNRDNSMEIHAYRKLGVGILTTHNWGALINSQINTDNFDGSFGYGV